MPVGLTRKNIYLFTDARYVEMVKMKSPFIQLVEINYQHPFVKTLEEILVSGNIASLGFEETNLTYKEAESLESIKGVEFIPTTDIVEELREIKDADEIENIRQACLLTDRAFEYITHEVKSGFTETEIKIMLENYIRAEGGKLAFESIVAFGKNSAIPHHFSNDQILNENDIILLDFGAKVNGYCADMTRTIFIGQPDPSLEKMYQTTLTVQQNAILNLEKHYKNDFKPESLHENANIELENNSYPPIPHGLGHGVGLQVHEHPTLSPFTEDVLRPGMLVTIEPGIYNPNIGGVRIEDTVLITKNGIEILTQSSKGLIVI